jgi:hypothetical protein
VYYNLTFCFHLGFSNQGAMTSSLRLLPPSLVFHAKNFHRPPPISQTAQAQCQIAKDSCADIVLTNKSYVCLQILRDSFGCEIGYRDPSTAAPDSVFSSDNTFTFTVASICLQHTLRGMLYRMEKQIMHTAASQATRWTRQSRAICNFQLSPASFSHTNTSIRFPAPSC